MSKYSVIRSENKLRKCFSLCSCKKFDFLDSEIWSILITLVFQDGPFLALRLTAVINYNVRTFVTMFFTCKNAIILFLQVYRLVSIYHENEDTEVDLPFNDQDLQKLDFSKTRNKSLVVAVNPIQSILVAGKNENVVVSDESCNCDCHRKRPCRRKNESISNI